MMRHIVLLLAAIMIACAQEPDLHLNLEERSPPAFSFSGRTPATKPLSKIDPFKVIGEAVWKISSSRKTKAADWPSVVYGEIPSGFSQSFPEGPPAKLSEGKLYLARIVGERNYQSALFFEVRNNKTINVTDKVFGP
jgi:hypothetical protein